MFRKYANMFYAAFNTQETQKPEALYFEIDYSATILPFHLPNAEQRNLLMSARVQAFMAAA
jgi:hypothetical protein